MKNSLWKTAILVRLALPLPHLRVHPRGCNCQDNHDSRAHNRGRRARRRPPDVDPFGDHDQCCPLAFSLGRHDEVQEGALRPTLAANNIHVSSSKTSELRREDDPFDHSRRKGDLTVTGLFDDGATILDVGITHPTIDSNISSLSSKVRAAGANAYAATKDRRAHAIIERKQLDIGFKAVTFGTYGAFGKATHGLIKAATANTPRPVFSPWVRPSPKQHAYLLFGFTLARANARMLINAASKRSSAKNAVRTSRSRSH